MKKKGIFQAIHSIAFIAIVAVMVLAACDGNGNGNGGNSGNNGGNPHTHSYSTTWSKNATQHWHECSCGDKTDVANHTGDPCTVCGYTSGGGVPTFTDGEWPDNEFTRQVPEPPFTIGEVTGNSWNITVNFTDVTFEGMSAYREEVRAAGFTSNEADIYPSSTTRILWNAVNGNNTWGVGLTSREDGTGNINIVKK